MGIKKALKIPFIILLCLTPLLFNTLSYSATKSPDACSSCVYANDSCNVEANANTWTTNGATRTFILIILIGLATYYIWKQYKRKLFLATGILLGLAVGASYIYASYNTRLNINKPTTCLLNADSLKNAGADSFRVASNDEFKPVTDEFSNTETQTDEFKSADSSSLSEFAPADSGFSSQTISEQNTDSQVETFDRNLFVQIISLFVLIVIIGLSLKYNVVRNLRPFILLASVVYLGFIKGGCPCMIMSFQNTVLFAFGNSVTWLSMLWFLGLVPLTYFFGKVWCGWLCHLGGFQDFLFKLTGWKLLTTQKSQCTLKIVQISLFAILIVQLFITHSNIYVHYDPFKVAFNLISANTTGYVLVILLLLSSVLIYRPFCRMACPVGLILGWVSLIPGARKLSAAQSSCNGCGSCSRTCKQYALQSSAVPVKINTTDCILCGECIGKCKRASLSVSCKR
jgi:NAD-dependent dihydropyrimidine dehydrogenase PreA subunit